MWCSSVSRCFILYALTLFLLDTSIKITIAHGKEENGEFMHHPPLEDPSLNVFFKLNDLRVGKTMPIFFPIKNPMETPKLLPRNLVDSIPFSSQHLPYLLEYFSYSQDSPQAKAMEYTLKQCELNAMKGETKFCATSLESMLDLTSSFFRFDDELKVLSTTYPENFSTTLQNYTIIEKPREIRVSKSVSCHTMAYPYTVFYCHGQESDNVVYQVCLSGENGDRIEAAAICHMNTSQWDHDHVVFKVMKMVPGTMPVCHFYPADNLVWVPFSSPVE